MSQIQLLARLLILILLMAFTCSEEHLQFQEKIIEGADQIKIVPLDTSHQVEISLQIKRPELRILDLGGQIKLASTCHDLNQALTQMSQETTKMIKNLYPDHTVKFNCFTSYQEKPQVLLKLLPNLDQKNSRIQTQLSQRHEDPKCIVNQRIEKMGDWKKECVRAREVQLQLFNIWFFPSQEKEMQAGFTFRVMRIFGRSAEDQKFNRENLFLRPFSGYSLNRHKRNLGKGGFGFGTELYYDDGYESRPFRWKNVGYVNKNNYHQSINITMEEKTQQLIGEIAQRVSQLETQRFLFQNSIHMASRKLKAVTPDVWLMSGNELRQKVIDKAPLLTNQSLEVNAGINHSRAKLPKEGPLLCVEGQDPVPLTDSCFGEMELGFRVNYFRMYQPLVGAYTDKIGLTVKPVLYRVTPRSRPLSSGPPKGVLVPWKTEGMRWTVNVWQLHKSSFKGGWKNSALMLEQGGLNGVSYETPQIKCRFSGLPPWINSEALEGTISFPVEHPDLVRDLKQLVQLPIGNTQNSTVVGKIKHKLEKHFLTSFEKQRDYLEQQRELPKPEYLRTNKNPKYADTLRVYVYPERMPNRILVEQEELSEQGEPVFQPVNVKTMGEWAQLMEYSTRVTLWLKFSLSQKGVRAKLYGMKVHRYRKPMSHQETVEAMSHLEIEL